MAKKNSKKKKNNVTKDVKEVKKLDENLKSTDDLSPKADADNSVVMVEKANGKVKFESIKSTEEYGFSKKKGSENKENTTGSDKDSNIYKKNKKVKSDIEAEALNADNSDGYDDSDIQEDSNLTAQDKESFVDFAKEAWSKYKEHVKKRKQLYYVIAACVAIVVVVSTIFIVINSLKKNSPVVNNANENTETSVEVPEDALECDAYPEVNELINKYFEYIAAGDIDSLSQIQDYIEKKEKAKILVKTKYIDSYSDIKCYTKKGPMENSFVCYVCYGVKMKDYDVVAPGLLAFLVCQNEDGEYYLYCSDFSKEMSDYTDAITKQNDVADLIKKVNTEYNDILNANPEFKDYMLSVNKMIKNEVGECLAGDVSGVNSLSDNNADDGNSVSDNSVSDNSVSDNSANTNKVEVIEVKTKETVNVRASDSEQADKLGKVTEGTVLTCNKQLDNGWSQVIFDGDVGYIKSEYLEKVSETKEENRAVTTGTVTVKETVKIRKEPSTNSESLGVAYAGETFPCVENQKNGWTKIIYDTKEAFIKTEFLSK